MSHIEAKSINIWLRNDPKCNSTSCPHSLDGEFTFWVISLANVDGFCFNMAHFNLDDHVGSRMSRGKNEENSNVLKLLILWKL